LEVIDHISSNKTLQSSSRSDRNLLAAEFTLTIDLLKHACKRGCYAFDSPEYNRQLLSNDLERIITDYPLIWLDRNRPGGLHDSLRYFDIARKEYLSD
jgi:hypothetical protein